MIQDIPLNKLRVFNNVFNKREKHQVLDEALYMKHKVYTTISIEKSIELSINKMIKQKIYKIQFLNNSKNVIKYKLDILEEYFRDL